MEIDTKYEIEAKVVFAQLGTWQICDDSSSTTACLRWLVLDDYGVVEDRKHVVT